MESIEPLPTELTRLQSRARIAGIISLGLCAIVALFSPSSREQFFTSYLFAYLLCLGLALGSLAIVMLHHLVGGDWGLPIRAAAESAAMTLPLLAVLFIPIACGAGHLYEWAQPDRVVVDHVLQHRKPYMDFANIRAAIYFIVWMLLAFAMTLNVRARLKQRISAWGLLLYVITITFASFDWILSRESHFYSTILGLLTGVSQTLTAMTFLIALLACLSRVKSVGQALTPSLLNDLGNLLMTLVILWSYMSFSQYLIVWMGNTAHDATFYARRGLAQTPNGWRVVGFILIVFHFFIPFALLLSRDLKRNLRSLTKLAMFVLALRVVDVFWTVTPSSTRPDFGFHISWMDVLMPIGIVGIWFWLFVAVLGRRRLVIEVEEEIVDGETNVQRS